MDIERKFLQSQCCTIFKHVIFERYKVEDIKSLDNLFSYIRFWILYMDMVFECI